MAQPLHEAPMLSLSWSSTSILFVLTRDPIEFIVYRQPDDKIVFTYSVRDGENNHFIGYLILKFYSRIGVQKVAQSVGYYRLKNTIVI